MNVCMMNMSVHDNPIPPGVGGGGAESARADFNFRELP